MEPIKLIVSPRQYASLQDAIGADSRSGAYISYGTICNWLRCLGKDPRDYMFKEFEIVVDRHAPDGMWRIDERSEEEFRRAVWREAIEVFKASPVVPTSYETAEMRRMAETLPAPWPEVEGREGPK